MEPIASQVFRRHLLTVLTVAFALAGCGGGSGGGDTAGNGSLGVPGVERQDGVDIERVFPNLELAQPVALLQAPGDASRWFVVERAGRVVWFDANDNETETVNEFMQLDNVDTSGEGGLLGMAFHPDFPNRGEVYLSYTVTGPDASTPLTSRISRFESTDGGQTLDPGSGQVIFGLDQPFTNHNGGQIAFGPDDGYLYFGLGDGGSGGDPGDRAQDPSNLFGALLRIDVDSAMDFGIPPENPFVGSAARDEIYAYGFRNPFRFSFDRATATLWLGDVGQSDVEEVDIVEAGDNYGWRCYEGSEAFDLDGCAARDTYTFPVSEYNHDEGQSITGGTVYRGRDIDLLQGIYVFGDFVSGTIWGLFPQDDGGFDRRVLVETDLSPVSFGQDESGEVYAVDIGGGLYRLAQSPQP